MVNLSLMSFLGRSRPYRGIRLIAYPPYQTDALAEVVDALEIIRKHDEVRFRRVTRFISRIVVGNWNVVGFYNSIGRVCGLQRRESDDHSRPFIVFGYAATIIHEATHGLLDQMRFPYFEKTRKRIERLCVMEEARFLVKFPGLRGRMDIVLGYVERPTKRKAGVVKGINP